MVEFTDGSTLAQVSPPDMRLPIALGLGWPDRVPGAVPACDWTRPATWTFEPLDDEAFPAVRLAREVAAQGGTFPAVLNAANEQCVHAFLDGRVPFLAIVDTVGMVVQDWGSASGDGSAALDVAAVLAAETWARERADRLLQEVARR
jgi:1-deoxy-D-xylulose-5-phosphate reductoisomerase